MTAEDKASAEVQAAAKRINDEYKKMENVNRAVGRSTMLNNRELFATARVMTSIGNIAGRLTDIYTKYNIMQLRIGDSARKVTEAQDDLRRAILQSGPDSEDAIDASRRLQDAQDDAKRAADEAKFAMVGFGLETLTAAGSIINALPRFAQLARTLKGLAGVSVATSLTGAAAAGGTILPGMAGAGATAAGVSTASKLAKNAGPLAAAATAGLVSYEYFSQPGDQTGLVDVNNPNAPGSLVNDAFATFINAISQTLGLGQQAAYTSDLKAQTQEINITVNGSDAQATANEVARQLQLAQVGR